MSLAPYRSRRVRGDVQWTEEQIVLPRLPAYAPELKSAGYTWGHLKYPAPANFCPRRFYHLSRKAWRSLRHSQRPRP
ncbi:hypothetical protein [Limisphaera sp. VF-2]|jgi:hypothetical protein|uniref:hypothetical protein n=1 Tax=Limisphaera sp. VF-2 TaxID=3400418 RepID=UPI00181E4FBE